MSGKNSVKIPPLPANLCEVLLDNPDRGFRLEVALDVGLNINPFFKEYEGATSYLKYQYDYYREDKPKLVQTYFYLSQYEDRDLDDKAFINMEKFFSALREMKLKALLRFAYETDFCGPKGATQSTILKHIEQLKPFIEKNKDVIHVFQAGFIGAWGEWHASKFKLDGKEILEAILEMLPEDMQVQVRLPDYKNLIPKEHSAYSRIGFHDDFIVNKQHQWDGGLYEGSEQFRQIVEECPGLLVDGELPWGSWSMEDGWFIDGFETIRRLSKHGYTSLSIVHNYREKGDNFKFSMCDWQKQMISEEWLSANSLNFSPAFFLDQYGKKVSRSVFDYVKYHLGYYLEVESIEIDDRIKKDEEFSINFKLCNHGFAAPIGLIKSELVLIDERDKIVAVSKAGDCKKWHPCCQRENSDKQLVHEISTIMRAPKEAGTYKIGLRIENSTQECVKLANKIPFVDGINILSGFNIDKTQ